MSNDGRDVTGSAPPLPGPYLIVQSGFLGDAILASGMLRGVAAASPGETVGLVVRAEFAGLFAGHPALARLHPFQKRRKGGTGEMIEELRGAGYQTVFLPHRSYRSAWIARRAGIARRIGFRQSDAPWLLSHRVDYKIAMHETERNATLLERAGLSVPAGERAPWLLPAADALERMRARFSDGRRLFILAPGSVWPTKRWGMEGYAALAARLRDAGCRVLLAGGADELELCREVASRGGVPASDLLCGELSLPDLLALTAIAERVITNDSAPLHLAESVGTPVTAVFGPTVPEFGFGPRGEGSAVVEIQGLPCRPCRIHGSERCPIGTHECMGRIAPEQVLAASGFTPQGGASPEGRASGPAR